MRPEDAEEYTQALGQVVAGGWRQIALGQRLGVPKALGLTVEEWVQKRLGGYVRLAVAERRHAVAELTAEGRSQRDVAAVLGVDPATVHHDQHAAENSAPPCSKSSDNGGSAAENSAPLNVIAGLAADEALRKEAAGQGTRQQRIERRQETAARLRRQVDLPDAKYRVIYADPPWSYNDKADAGSVQSGGAARHYPTMSIAQLCDLRVANVCEDNAVLFLWVTSPLLFECAPVFTAWGFTYKTSFVWDKVKHNMGHYNSVRHEHLLVCTRGSCTPDIVELFDSVQSIERSTHSTKPEEFRSIITTLYPHGKRLELFARREADGWDCWGNEVEAREVVSA